MALEGYYQKEKKKQNGLLGEKDRFGASGKFSIRRYYRDLFNPKYAKKLFL